MGHGAWGRIVRRSVLERGPGSHAANRDPAGHRGAHQSSDDELPRCGVWAFGAREAGSPAAAARQLRQSRLL